MKRQIQLLNIKTAPELTQEMKKIGVDPKGIQIMQPKGISYALKIKGISSAAANILKQEMLSRGGEVALPWQALNKPKSFVDILLFGTKNQYQHLINKIKIQPFQLQEVSYAIKNILNNIENPCPKITIGSKTFNLAKKVLLMGILNITPDSFSDGGKYLTPASAVQRAHKLLKDGADIIDLGAESSRPGAKEISAQEELKRLVPVLQTLLKKTKAIISIDTTKALVAKKCLELGVHMINDISGLKSDPQMAKVVAKFNVPIILMHRSGKSKVMQKKTKYQDFISDLIASLNQSIEIAQKAGIKKDKIIIDPGIGFGKSTAQNLEIFKRLSEFKSLGFPILIGASRKSMIGNVLNLPIDQRLEGSLALSALAISNGANILRVHDVKENARVIKMCQAILQTPRT